MAGYSDVAKRAAATGAKLAVAQARRVATEARAAGVMYRAGMIGGGSVSESVQTLKALSAFGQLGAPIVVAAIKHGDRTGLIDELGSLTFKELNDRSNALAATLRARGIGENDCVGILCRNHRGFFDITFAAAKLGARILFLNTDFGAPQLRDVVAREQVTLLVHDEEYNDMIGGLEVRHGTLIAWTDGDAEHETLESLIATGLANGPVQLAPPPNHAKVVLLTSGTTGTPKGAPRSSSKSIAPVGAVLSKVPYKAGESTYVAPPMFHGVGYTQALLSVSLGSTVITERRFNAERVLAAITAHRPTGLVVVPVMLRRIVTVLEESDPAHPYDTSSLRVVFVSGSQLEAELVRRAERVIGQKLYNFYGSTECAYATFATPEDLHAAPGCAGRPPFGTVVKLYDEDGRAVNGTGRIGRIFVGNTFQFDGYTGGGGKDMIDGLMATGDVGHFDGGGRLFVDGRDDDMIVSGGENLFPGEVEELLITNPAVEEASVIGVDDDEYGKRLAAFIVLREGQQLSAEEVRAFVKANLARFKVPRDVIFIEELPRNPSGKVLKRTLREMHGQLAAHS
jgi:fatty-acyl-CoA synthase